MKIGFVFDDSLDRSDGVQQYILALGGWLESEGNEIHYLVGQTERRDIKNVHSLGRNMKVRFNGNGLSVPMPAATKTIEDVLSQRFDVLHVQMPYSPWLAGKVMRLADRQTAVVATFHIAPYSQLVTTATRILAIWSRRSLKRLQLLISVSAAAQDFASQTYRLPSQIIPNTFDYQRFKRAQPLSVYKDQTVTILFLGRLVARKGCQVLLEAITLLQTRDVGSYRVLICGSGPLEAELKHYTQQQKLTMVTFVGRISESDKPRYLASADIAVFPSSGGESFGIVLLEAMASGRTAVLAGDNSGYHAVMANQPASLFKPKDAAVLADKLAHYLTRRQDRQALAAHGQQLAASYDTSIVGRRIVEAYKTVIAKNTSSKS